MRAVVAALFLPISILKKISFLSTNKRSWRNHNRSHVCPTRSHCRSHVLFHHGMFPHRDMYMCPKGSSAGYLDLLKTLILDASPANRLISGNRSQFMHRIPILPNQYKVLPDFMLLKGDRGCGCLTLAPYPALKAQDLSSFLLVLLYCCCCTTVTAAKTQNNVNNNSGWCN